MYLFYAFDKRNSWKYISSKANIFGCLLKILALNFHLKAVTLPILLIALNLFCSLKVAAVFTSFIYIFNKYEFGLAIYFV